MNPPKPLQPLRGRSSAACWWRFDSPEAIVNPEAGQNATGSSERHVRYMKDPGVRPSSACLCRTRGIFLLAIVATLFASAPEQCSAQTPEPELAMAGDPDAARMAVASLLGQLGETVIGAARDTSARPWRINFPAIEGSRWAEYEEIVLRTIRGRRETATDSAMGILALSELQMHGDTLVARFFIGYQYFCDGQWRGSGTGYVMTSTRHALIDGWSRPQTMHASDSDSLPCRRE